MALFPLLDMVEAVYRETSTFGGNLYGALPDPCLGEDVMIALVTGGAASGKSEYAELSPAGGGRSPHLLGHHGGGGRESLSRVDRHRRARAGKGFCTVECPRDLERLSIPSGSTVLLECLTNLLANEMYPQGDFIPDPTGKILAELEHLLERAAHLVVVSGGVFPAGAGGDGGLPFALGNPPPGAGPPGGSGGGIGLWHPRIREMPERMGGMKGFGRLSWWRFPLIRPCLCPKSPWNKGNMGYAMAAFPLGGPVGGRGPGFVGMPRPPDGV